MNFHTAKITIGSNRGKSNHFTDKNPVSQEEKLYVRDAGAPDGTNETKTQKKKLKIANPVQKFVSTLTSNAKDAFEKIVSVTALKPHAAELRESVEEFEGVPPIWAPGCGWYPQLPDQAQMIVITMKLGKGKDSEKITADVEVLLAAAKYYGDYGDWESQLKEHPEYADAFNLRSDIENLPEHLTEVCNRYGGAQQLRELCLNTPFLGLLIPADQIRLIKHIVSLE